MANIVRANINWTAKSLAQRIARGTVSLDNAVQRGFVWDDNRQSLLIHSMLTGYPIPVFFASKDGDKYDMLDGKQRATTICRFLNDEFKLKNIPEIEHEVTVEGAEGEEPTVETEILDLNGKKFSELPEDIQDAIKDYSFNIAYFDGITDDQISEMFCRLNNGKPLSSIELTRVKAKSLDTIKAIARHPIFSTALTEAAIKRYTDEDIIIKAWVLINDEIENPSFDTKTIRSLTAEADITDEQRTQLETAFTRILDTYNYIKDNTFDVKLGKKISKRIVTRTHLLSLVPFAIMSVEDGVSVERFAKWASEFYSGTRSASVDETYNANAGQGSAKPENIRRRNTALMNSYTAFFNGADLETA